MTANPSRDLWERLAALAGYPGPGFRADLVACHAAACRVSPEAAAHVRAFGEALADARLETMQERYAETFDFDPECTLNLTWHLVGDGHRRGGMLSALAEDLGRAGLRPGAELPDHLTHVLSLVAHGDAGRAPTIGTALLPAVEKIRHALERRDSPYAHLLLAIESMLTAWGRDPTPAGQGPQGTERSLP